MPHERRRSSRTASASTVVVVVAAAAVAHTVDAHASSASRAVRPGATHT
jgi:hypothetical protein